MESENLASRHAALCKRRSSLFKKASELAILCDAEVAIIIKDSDGNISEFASSNSSIQKIVKRFKICYESWKRRSLKSKMEEPKKEEEVSREIQPRQNINENKLRNVLGKDFDLTSSDELAVLLEKFNQGLMSLKETKMQLLKEELEQSRTQKEEVLQTNQILKKQVEDLQALTPQIYCPVPLDVHFPDMEGEARTSSREYISSTSVAAPPAITNGPETQHNFQNADTTSPPSTANFSMSVEPSNRASVENRLSSSEEIYTTNLTLSLAPTCGTSMTQLE